MVRTQAIPDRKLEYAAKLNEYLDNYHQAISIGVTNVGSKALATQRKNLRTRDIHILMGKNVNPIYVLSKPFSPPFFRPSSVKFYPCEQNVWNLKVK
jgi:hypothetical protein